jgi:hypothetical protein
MIQDDRQHRAADHPQTASPRQHGNGAQQAGRDSNGQRGQDGVFPGDSLGPERRPGRADAARRGLTLFLLGKLELRRTAVGAEHVRCAEVRATSMAEQIHPS